MPIEKVFLDPPAAVLRLPEDKEAICHYQVVWKFLDVPSKFVPTIEIVGCVPGQRFDGEMYTRPFKTLEYDHDTITGVTYGMVTGRYRYEVVLIPKQHSGEKLVRLDCENDYMGSVEISEPPP